MNSASTIGNTVKYGLPSDGSTTCDFAIDCLVTQVLEPSGFVVTVSGLLIVSLAIGHLTDAIEAVETEIERTSIERAALEVFADRVATLEATEPSVSTGRTDRFHAVTDGGTDDEVFDAYRETVMAVPHYDREYDESLETNMAVELGEEVTLALLNSEQLSPTLQQAIVTKADRAARLRREFIETLETERTHLQTAGDRLETIWTDYQALLPIEGSGTDSETINECLDRLETRCEDVIQSRQVRIHDEPLNRRLAHQNTGPTLQEYLYEPLPVTYPILNAGTEIIADLRTSRQTISS